MSRLVTGLFYERGEAESAVMSLRDSGIPADCIYLEGEVEPTELVGTKGGEVGAAERERRIAGLETGLIIGFCVGLLAGFFVYMLAAGMQDMTRSVAESGPGMPAILTNGWATAGIGAILGLAAGGAIGWMIDFTLDRMGAGPALPKQEPW